MSCGLFLLCRSVLQLVCYWVPCEFHFLATHVWYSHLSLSLTNYRQMSGFYKRLLYTFQYQMLCKLLKILLSLESTKSSSVHLAQWKALASKFHNICSILHLLPSYIQEGTDTFLSPTCTAAHGFFFLHSRSTFVWIGIFLFIHLYLHC